MAIRLPELGQFSIAELLTTHSLVLDELQKREVVRSKNNPAGDFTEWLVCKQLDLSREKNSAKGFDATDTQGQRYQIKGRRKTPGNKSTQLGVIRNIDGEEFDFLVAVIFHADWQIHYAAKIPFHVVRMLVKPRQHVNGHIMHFPHSVFDTYSSVEDITQILRSTQPT